MNEQNQQNAQPMAHAKNIFEGINNNIVEMSRDNVATNQLVQNIAARLEAVIAKVDAIYAALYQPIPDNSPNDPGEGEGSENE